MTDAHRPQMLADERDGRPGVQPTVGYLLAEFDTAWRHLGGLEDKRLKLFLGYCLVATGILSLAFSNIALSERQATERYRNKINLLRRTLLDILASPALSAMQREGSDWALQISANPAKNLRAFDLLQRSRWTTALFMKLTYDVGSLAGLVLALGSAWA